MLASVASKYARTAANTKWRAARAGTSASAPPARRRPRRPRNDVEQGCPCGVPAPCEIGCIIFGKEKGCYTVGSRSQMKMLNDKETQISMRTTGQMKRDIFWSKLLLALIFILIVFLTASCTSNNDSFVKSLSFISDKSGKPQIYVMRDDGTHQIRLTSISNPMSSVNMAGMFAHDWSPDGKYLAFVSDMDAGVNQDIYRMDADGSNIKRLTFCEKSNCFHYFPTWSPDGTKIAFSSTRDGVIDMYVMNLDGSAQIRLTHNVAPTSSYLYPYWSPDGNRIAFVNYASGSDSGIYVIQMNDLNAGHFFTDKSFQFALEPLSWSPDGVSVLATSHDYENIYVLNTIDGTFQKVLGSVISHTDEFENFRCPMWSPDGKHIIYYYSHSVWTTRVESGFYIIDEFGLNRNLIINDEGEWHLKTCPAQTSDRQRMVFSAVSSQKTDQSDIYVVNIDGTGLKRLTNSASNEESPRWRP